MTRAGRYTTRLQAGLGLVDETERLLALYQEGMRPTDLYQAALDSGRFPTLTARRLRNIVTEGFAPRYMNPPRVALTLRDLAKRFEPPEFLQLLLLHTARANLILADFIRQVFWPRYSAGQSDLLRQDAVAFVETAVQDGKTQGPWSQGTIERVASYLLGTCTDFGLLSANRAGVRRIHPVRLQTRVAAYLAYDLKHQGLGDNQILSHDDWQLFGLDRQDVRQQLKQLSLRGYLIMQSAGDVTQITWKHKTQEEVLGVLAGQ